MAITFDGIKQINEFHAEYWSARELQQLLGYTEWRNFSKVIEKAKISCRESGNSIEEHFVELNKTLMSYNQYGEVTGPNVNDFHLSRYACYLIAQNGNPQKKEIALAQSYFASQTRKQEVFEELQKDYTRLDTREEISEQNKKLIKTAKDSGVVNFGTFNDAGYRGLYGMRYQDIVKKKGLGKDKLLDRANTTELAANLFRITQTEEKLRKDGIISENRAVNTHFMVGGKIRETIKDIGGDTPENILPGEHIKEVKKRIKSKEKILGITPEKKEKIKN